MELLGLHQKLRDIANYLDKVYQKKLPINHTILGKLQNVFNLLPNLANSLVANEGVVDLNASSNTLSTAFTIKTNDELMVVYICTLVRAIIAFHDLIENKLQNKKLNESKSDSKTEADEISDSAEKKSEIFAQDT